MSVSFSARKTRMCHIFALKRMTVDKIDRICSYLPHLAHMNVSVSLEQKYHFNYKIRLQIIFWQEGNDMSYICPCKGVSADNRHWMEYNLFNVILMNVINSF
ncbi:unnamed protein product [Boreogadus saida]